jgi:hypothetical protein
MARLCPRTAASRGAPISAFPTPTPAPWTTGKTLWSPVNLPPLQNSYLPSAERGPSVTDRRHRFEVVFSAEPRPFHRGDELLGYFFNDWKISTVLNYGSGRPVNATVTAIPTRMAMISTIGYPAIAAMPLPGPTAPQRTLGSRA